MTSVVIQENERGTYSRARTSYVDDRRENGLGYALAPQFTLGATAGWGAVYNS